MGSINLDNTGSGSAITLTSDGTSLLVDGTAIGGGSAFTAPEVKTSSWSVTNSDKGKVYIVDTDNLTLTLPEDSTLDDDWFIRIYTKGGGFQPSYGQVGDLTIDPQYSTHSGRVNGNTSWTMRSRQGGVLFVDPEAANNFIFDTHSTNWDIDVHSTANANRANATGWGGVAISGQATASGTGAIGIGYLSYATGNDSIAIGGNSAQAVATDAIALGNSRAGGTNSVAIGINNNTSSYGVNAADGIAIGNQAKSPTADGIAIGRNTNSNNGAIAIGYNSYTTAVRGVAVGYDCSAGYQAANFGYGNAATGNFSLSLGHSNTSSHANSAAIGYGVQTSATNQVSLGGSTQTVRISEAYSLPTTDGTNGQVLTTDGSGAVTFADVDGVGGATGVDFNDDVRARWGTGNDLEIYHDSTTNKSHITETGSSHLVIQGQEIQFKNASGTDLMALNSAQVELFFNGSKKLETNTSGITTTGTVNVNGAYTLPTADGTNGQVLTTDGAGAVTFADAGGGASEYTYSDKTSSYTITSSDLGKIIRFTSGTVDATLPANSGISTGFYVSVWNDGTGVISVKPNGSDYIGESSGNGYTSSDPYKLNRGKGVTLSWNGTRWNILAEKPYDYYHHSIAIGSNANATNNYAMAIGNRSSASGVGTIAIGTGLLGPATATAQYAVALGEYATASGSNSVAFGTARAQGASSFAVNLGNTGSLYKAGGTNSIAMGSLARAPDNHAIAIGEGAQTAAANAIALGSGSEASNAYSIALGGRYARTGADYSMATGYWSRSHVVGSKVHASGRFSSWGDAQTGTYVLRSDTTNATAEAMTADNSTAGTTNQVILPNNSAYFFSGTIIARQDAASGTDVGAWEIKGAIRREANAASTVLVKSTIDDFNVPTGWAVALTADTTNGGLAITVTGAAATNIRWVATVNTSEVTY